MTTLEERIAKLELTRFRGVPSLWKKGFNMPTRPPYDLAHEFWVTATTIWKWAR